MKKGNPFIGIYDITVDETSALYAFDYGKYNIKKYDKEGKLLFIFGGTGDEDGKFNHLTGIRAVGGRILAVDAIGLSLFDYGGNFLEKVSYGKEVMSEFPAIFDDGRFVGKQILADEQKIALIYRAADGEELSRLDFYEISEFFPGIKKGERFFLDDTYVRAYRYTISPDGDIIWAASDALRIYRYHKGKSSLVIEDKATAVTFPDELRKPLLERQARTKPPLFSYVPDRYQIIHHLLCGPEGDVWAYVKSRERTGFLHYSKAGKFEAFYEVEADFDMTNAVVRLFNDQFYFVVNEKERVKVYSASF